MVFGKGIPVVSVLIWNQGQSKLYRIGDMMEEITIQADVDHLTQVYTGKLVGIELGPAQVRADKPGYMSYDNIPTDGYENPICAMVPNIDATHEVVKILIQTEDGSYIPLMMEEIDSIRLADNEWITSVKEALESYLDSADLSGINEISLDNDQNMIDISIFDKGILNLGFVDFLATVEGLVSARARINNQTYVMTIGSEETYDTFRQGLLDSIPAQSGETVKGDLTMANGDGTSLVYTLKVTYFNQADEFNKITDYLDGYSAEDATVVKSADKTYTVTTHVASGDLLFDLIGAVVGIENLTNVKLTVGKDTTESTDAATLREFLNARIPFSSDAAQAVVTVEVTAGELTETYSVTYASDYIADPEAIIGTKRYATLAEAVAAAVSGDTITLQKSLTLNNASVGAVNNPVVIVPNGVTFDGNGNSLTADNDSWVGTNANHIIGISGTTGTIKNVTLVGNGKNKSGVVVYGSADAPGNATLENVTSQNNGNCGVQVAGSTVVATGLNTSGNTWGGVNVDKSSEGAIPNFTFNSGTLAENVEIYTEITDQDVITAVGMTKYQGYGETLKGFIYYTTDVSRLGTITAGNVVYETLNDAAASETPVEVTLTQNLTENLTVPVGGNLTIDGAGKTISGAVVCTAAGSGNSSLTLKNLTVDGSNGEVAYGIRSQNQTDNDQMELTLNLENVNVQGFSRKAIYGTNIKTLNITGGKIADCATGQMDDPNTQGDYAIDLNLVAVQGVTVVIDGVTFSGDLGDKAAIKITQRGGASDQGASDIPKNVGEASIESVVIQNCDFSGSTTEVDFRIGTDNKTPDGDGLNTTGAFAVTLTGNTEMVVQSAYLEGEPTLTVPAGRSASKTDSTDITLDMTTEETLDSIMAAIPGASEESDNVYTITTSDTIDMSFVDQIIALDGFASMTVSDGDASYSYTTGTDASYFKSQIQTLLPTSNEGETVNLTITVNFSA